MKNRVMIATPLRRRQIESRARELLQDFDPEALINLRRLDVEQLYEVYIPKAFGVDTTYEELSSGIHGYTDPSNMRSAVSIDLVDAEDQPTLRFGRSTIGHEVAHCVLHADQFRKRRLSARFTHDQAHASPSLFRQSDLALIENPEWQAWEFCKAIFLPARVLTSAVHDGFTIREISRLVDMNPAFVESRLRNLRLLDAARAF